MKKIGLAILIITSFSTFGFAGEVRRGQYSASATQRVAIHIPQYVRVTVKDDSGVEPEHKTQLKVSYQTKTEKINGEKTEVILYTVTSKE
ncbi:MAG: hypothetical protein AB1393_09600 [Candidatus Edwardsbacteria bacterium]